MTLLDVGSALDINDNGRLGWPDLAGWTFLSVVGVFAVLVVAGVLGAALFALVRLLAAAATAIPGVDVPGFVDRSDREHGGSGHRGRLSSGPSRPRTGRWVRR